MLLGMPGEPKHPGPAGHLDRLDHAAGLGPAGGDESLAELVDALVVVGARRNPFGTHHERRQRTRLQAHVVVGELTGGVHVQVGVGEMLFERAAAGDVQELHSAADPEHGHVALQRPPRHADLESVALGLVALRAPIGLGAIGGGVEVRAPREYERVEEVEQLVRRFGAGLVGRQDHRDRAGVADAERVGALGDVRLDAPPGHPVRGLERCADPDHRSAHHSLSKPLKRSQSVTVASNASSSTLARLR